MLAVILVVNNDARRAELVDHLKRILGAEVSVGQMQIQEHRNMPDDNQLPKRPIVLSTHVGEDNPRESKLFGNFQDAEGLGGLDRFDMTVAWSGGYTGLPSFGKDREGVVRYTKVSEDAMVAGLVAFLREWNRSGDMPDAQQYFLPDPNIVLTAAIHDLLNLHVRIDAQTISQVLEAAPESISRDQKELCREIWQDSFLSKVEDPVAIPPLLHRVRDILDRLDSAGRTTRAVAARYLPDTFSEDDGERLLRETDLEAEVNSAADRFAPTASDGKPWIEAEAWARPEEVQALAEHINCIAKAVDNLVDVFKAARLEIPSVEASPEETIS